MKLENYRLDSSVKEASHPSTVEKVVFNYGEHDYDIGHVISAEQEVKMHCSIFLNFFFKKKALYSFNCDRTRKASLPNEAVDLLS